MSQVFFHHVILDDRTARIYATNDVFFMGFLAAVTKEGTGHHEVEGDYITGDIDINVLELTLDMLRAMGGTADASAFPASYEEELFEDLVDDEALGPYTCFANKAGQIVNFQAQFAGSSLDEGKDVLGHLSRIGFSI